jgi:diguanylate cyclase (GGDEF)-like protein
MIHTGTYLLFCFLMLGLDLFMIKVSQKQPVTLFNGAAAAALLMLAGYLVAILSFSPDGERAAISETFTFLTILLSISALSIAALRSAKTSRRIGWVWGLFALAEICVCLGDILAAASDRILNQSLPFPSADILYLVSYPLFAAGAFLIPFKLSSPAGRIKRTLQVAIVTISMVLVYWTYLVGPVLAAAPAGAFLKTGLVCLYPIFDLLILVATLSIFSRLTEHLNQSVIFILILGFTVCMVCDTIFSYQKITGNDDTTGWLLNIGWITGYLFIGLAGVFQATAVLPGTATRPLQAALSVLIKKIEPFLPLFPHAWLIGSYALLIGSFLRPNQNGFWPMAISVGAVIGLVIMLQVVTYFENHGLNARLQTALDQVRQQAQDLARSNESLQQEILERQRAEERLVHDALHDNLTGLPNRALLADRLGRAIEYNQRRPDFPFTVLFLDLDHFKIINDSLGHQTGDQLLIAIARRLSECVRTSDTVARPGGDEFVLLLENIPDQTALKIVIDRITSSLAQPFNLDGREIFVTASIGVVLNLFGYTSADDVLRDADIAMYRAKDSGKARAEIFIPDLRTRAISRLELENDMRHALENHEFQLYYQPIIALQSNRVLGFEALIRWNHPLRGMLPPAEFIPISEESGLIIPIGAWVLQEACTQIRRWKQTHPSLQSIFVNVNVSGMQIVQPNFGEQVAQVLQSSGLSPSDLKLEITESVLVNNYQTSDTVFNQLEKLGVQIEIDDFGRGYSSLGYLQDLPVHTIKIDRSFVQEMEVSEKGSGLIRTIIRMAHDLGLETIAEGIETDQQLTKLKQLMCSYGQGYLLSRPMDASAAEKYLLKA